MNYFFNLGDGLADINLKKLLNFHKKKPYGNCHCCTTQI